MKQPVELASDGASFYFRRMPSDAERWRFVSDHLLTLHTDGHGYLVHWCRTAGPGEPPKFYPVSNGATAEEALDRAIERYNRKHRNTA